MVVGWIKRQNWVQIEANLLVFTTLGGLGIVLWFLWCAIIFGDPLYFHDYLFGPTSVANAQFYTYHNVGMAIWVDLVLSMKTVGPILFALALLAFLVFAFQLLRAPLRRGPRLFGAVAFLTPFVFYMLVFYTGQDTVYLPGIGPANTPHYFWNVRFGVESVAPVALFISILATRWSFTRIARRLSLIVQVALVIVICVQSLMITSSGIISLQDGMYGASCEPTEQITIYLAQHYVPGDKILEDVNAFPINEADIGMNLKDAIYEGSGPLWNQALKNPASTVQWIIAPTKLSSDLIASHINLESPAFRSQFTLIMQNWDSLSLFHRNGLPPLPTRPVPSSLLTEHNRCGGVIQS